MSMKEVVTTHQILKEASAVELNNIEMVDESTCISEIEDMLEEMDTIDTSVVYTEEMVNLFEVNGDVLVEYDNLIKFMDYSKGFSGYCDEKMAIKKLAEHYKLDAERFVIIVENKEAYLDTLESLKLKIQKETDPQKKGLLKGRMALIKNNLNKLKGKGIKVIKKQ